MLVKLLFFALVVRVGAVEYKKKDLKDLLTLSVENTISLNAVVTAQTRQIGELMIAMSSNKVEIDKLNAKYSEALDKIALLEAKDKELDAKDEQLDAKDEQLEAKDQQLEAKDQQLEAKDQQLEAKDQQLEAKDQQLETKDQELEVVTDDLRADLELVENPVHILNGEEDNGNPKCARVCSGTSGRDTTNWHSSYWVAVDITSCGFVKIPTITTSIESRADTGPYQVTSGIYGATTTGFELYVGGNDRTSYVQQNAAKYNWNIEWIAVGFTC